MARRSKKSFIKVNTFTATVKANAHGFAFLIPEGKKERECDFFVAPKNLCGALDRDVVLASPVRGTRDEAYVIKILKRGRTAVCGRFEELNDCCAVFADDHAYLSDIYIPRSLSGGAVSGDKVVAQITGYLKDGTANGKVIEILGKDGELFCEERAIIREGELKEEFPEYVLTAAAKVAAEPVLPDGRRDLRDVLTITIDGEDTRDMDDAVSLEIKDGKYILGVHIADVSRYVKYSGCIEREAFERGTSVYFPDRVLPMLPPSLSNGACSLNPGEDRYALSCVMTFSESGVKESFEFFESVIKSDRQLTYTRATELLDGVKVAEDDAPIAELLSGMARLCTLLEDGKNARGAVDLDIKEGVIYLDERGEIVIPEAERTFSHRIIEQFMIAANECAADFALCRNAPFIYRVHEQPAPEKASLLFNVARDLGIRVNANAEDVRPCDYADVLRAAYGKPFKNMLNTVMLRSMQKAGYSEKNSGHFGLALKKYCHFTSPIRRYPDLFVHRVIKLLLKDGDGLERLALNVQRAARQSSERERRAESAERAVDGLYKWAYMQKRIGEEFDGIISGVTDRGIFVELKNTVEGFIRIDDLPADRYFFYEDAFMLKGSKRRYKIGDGIRVKAVDCEGVTCKVRFIPV